MTTSAAVYNIQSRRRTAVVPNLTHLLHIIMIAITIDEINTTCQRKCECIYYYEIGIPTTTRDEQLFDVLPGAVNLDSRFGESTMLLCIRVL